MSERAPSIGTLTDRVQWQRRELTPEPEGGHVALFVPAATLWARVRALQVRAAVVADGRSSMATHSVVLRFRSDVQPGDRLIYRGRVLDVRGTEDLDGRRAWLACACVAVEAMG